MDKLNVVIIEDDKDVAGFLDFTVQSLGYETAVSYNGAAALDSLRQTTPDLILLDMVLPDINGDEILRHVRADDRLKHMPVVVLTGESRTLNKEVEKQANFVLVKPIDFQTLSQLITRLTNLSPALFAF
ncbi:MAG: response regulator [Chloroflexi bacterium]|nr:response regulator [Chloroflexota bacterium]